MCSSGGPEHHRAEVGGCLAAVERAFDNVAIGRRPEQGPELVDGQPGAGLQLSGLRQGLQAQEQPAQSSEMGVRQGAAVPVSALRLSGKAEDAHRAAHGAHAQGEDLQAGARLR